MDPQSSVDCEGLATLVVADVPLGGGVFPAHAMLVFLPQGYELVSAGGVSFAACASIFPKRRRPVFFVRELEWW